MFDSVSTERILVLLKNGLGRDSVSVTRRYFVCLMRTMSSKSLHCKLAMM